VTDSTARTVANVVVVSAGVAAAYLIVTKPRFRRLASSALRIWLGASLPVYLANEVRDAWIEAGRPAPDIMAR
jgi:hypothetical protein